MLTVLTKTQPEEQKPGQVFNHVSFKKDQSRSLRLFLGTPNEGIA